MTRSRHSTGPFFVRLPVHERAERGTPHVTPQVTPQVGRLLAVADGELRGNELQTRLGIADRKHFRITYLAPAIEAGLIEMTDPTSPNSPQQRYRFTDLGRRLRDDLAAREPDDTEKDPE